MAREPQPYMQNRELSWLTFNERVLEEARDPSNPLAERLKFVSIFTSNLDEFFMIRVGSLRSGDAGQLLCGQEVRHDRHAAAPGHLPGGGAAV